MVKLRKKHFLIIVVSYALLFFSFVGYMIHINNKKWVKADKWLDSLTIQCTGKIVNKTQTSRGGRSSIICCIEVSYSNIDSITIENSKFYQYFKLKNNIAFITIIGYKTDADSVSINMENNRKIRLYNQNQLIVEYPLSFFIGYVKKDDLEVCFH